MGSEREPIRIQRKRMKGWRMPEGAVYVGRPTRYGNPYSVKVWGTRERAVGEFRALMRRWGAFRDLVKMELRGKDLACWCPLDQPCHADVLLELANGKDVADAR
jgi:hypothetical protein